MFNQSNPNKDEKNVYDKLAGNPVTLLEKMNWIRSHSIPASFYLTDSSYEKDKVNWSARATITVGRFQEKGIEIRAELDHCPEAAIEDLYDRIKEVMNKLS